MPTQAAEQRNEPICTRCIWPNDQEAWREGKSCDDCAGQHDATDKGRGFVVQADELRYQFTNLREELAGSSVRASPCREPQLAQNAAANRRWLVAPAVELDDGSNRFLGSVPQHQL